MINLANEYHITRQGVFKILKRYGIDTSKRKLDVSCKVCCKVFGRTKGRIRKQLNHFCNQECYSAFIEAGNRLGKYKPSQGDHVRHRRGFDVAPLWSGE